MISEARKRARAKSGTWKPLPNTGGTKPAAEGALALPLSDSRSGSDVVETHTSSTKIEQSSEN
jgi:hypothetical protein